MRISDWSSDVCSSDLIGMQQRRAMRIQGALGVAGGAGGVAQAASRVLVELRPLESGVIGSQPVAINRQIARSGVGGLIEQHPLLHDGTLRPELLDQLRKLPVVDKHEILRIIDDEGDRQREV